MNMKGRGSSVLLGLGAFIIGPVVWLVIVYYVLNNYPSVVGTWETPVLWLVGLPVVAVINFIFALIKPRHFWRWPLLFSALPAVLYSYGYELSTTSEYATGLGIGLFNSKQLDFFAIGFMTIIAFGSAALGALIKRSRESKINMVPMKRWYAPFLIIVIFIAFGGTVLAYVSLNGSQCDSDSDVTFSCQIDSYLAVPNLESKCISAGGEWFFGGSATSDYSECYPYATDSGQSCTDSNQCEYICITEKATNCTDNCTGQCTKSVNDGLSSCERREMWSELKGGQPVVDYLIECY
ncbi:hypothetical protein ACFL04_04660 [Patescibacteria group bacterium]